jgi:hypothetical protein
MPHTAVAAVTRAGLVHIRLVRVRLALLPAAVVGMAAERLPGVAGVVITVAAEAVAITAAAEAVAITAAAEVVAIMAAEVATVVVGTQRRAAPLAERTAANL